MSPPAIGRAVIFNRPFGPACVFGCPRGKGTCSVEVNPTPGDGPRWENHGSEEAPTFTPSVNCTSCGWHGYIAKGHCTDAPNGMSLLHVCTDCKKPEIIAVQLRHNVNGQLEMHIGIGEVPGA